MEELPGSKSVNEPANEMSAQSTPRNFLDHTGRPNACWNPQMVRALLDYIDQNKGESSVFIRDKETALAGASQAMTENVPPQLLVHLTPKQIESKCSKLIRRAAKKPRPRVRDLWLQGSDALDLLSLPPGTFADEELEVVRQEKELQLSRKHGQSQGCRAGGGNASHGSNHTPDIPDPTADIARLQTATRGGLVKDGPNIKKIQNVMKILQDRINAAVPQRLEAAEIATDQPVMLSSVPLNPGLRNLMGSVVQSGGPKLDIMQAHQRLQLDHLLRALIGAAVTRWVLEAVFEEGGLMYEALVNVLKKYDSNLAATLEEEARKHYLDRHFRAKIPDRARLWAQQLDQLLAPLLAPSPSADPTTLEESVSRFKSPTPSPSLIEVGSVNNDGEDNLTTSIDTLDALAAPQWLCRWKKDLQDIFEQALRLRLTLDLEGGEYVYHFPSPGTRYIAVKRPDLRRSARDSTSDSVVMLALFPKISGCFQTLAGGKYTEWQDVADATIVKYSRA